MALLLTTISTTKFSTYPVQLYSNSEQSSLDLLALDKVNLCWAELGNKRTQFKTNFAVTKKKWINCPNESDLSHLYVHDTCIRKQFYCVYLHLYNNV